MKNVEYNTVNYDVVIVLFYIADPDISDGDAEGALYVPPPHLLMSYHPLPCCSRKTRLGVLGLLCL